MTEQEKQSSQMACVWDDLNCWGALDTTCGRKTKDTTPSTAWRREAWKEEALDDLPWKDERGPSSIRRTLEMFQRQRWGSFWETWWNAYNYVLTVRIGTILNWTELLILFRSITQKMDLLSMGNSLHYRIPESGAITDGSRRKVLQKLV